jgi:hypothetical protein
MVKQKKKRKKRKKNKGSSPSAWAFGTRGRLNFFKKARGFPECLGIRHSGKGKFKKRQGLPRVPGHLALGEGHFFKKKGTVLPRVPVHGHSGMRFSKTKMNFFPECCTRGRGFKKKEISSPNVALGDE